MPKPPISDDFSTYSPFLYGWMAYDSSTKVDLYSSACLLENKLIFIDPIELEKNALLQLIDESQSVNPDAKPAAIILTNANHARAAQAFQKRFHIPIYANRQAAELLQKEDHLKIDHPIESFVVKLTDFSSATSTLTIYPLEGFAVGEMALLFTIDNQNSTLNNTLIIGDALINLPLYGHGLSLLPAKYCRDIKLAQKSMKHFVDSFTSTSFDKLLFAHGEPILQNAATRMIDILPNLGK